MTAKFPESHFAAPVCRIPVWISYFSIDEARLDSISVWLDMDSQARNPPQLLWKKNWTKIAHDIYVKDRITNMHYNYECHTVEKSVSSKSKQITNITETLETNTQIFLLEDNIY